MQYGRGAPVADNIGSSSDSVHVVWVLELGRGGVINIGAKIRGPIDYQPRATSHARKMLKPLLPGGILQVTLPGALYSARMKV